MAMTPGWRIDRPIVMIGCGNMAGAMLSRWIECGLAPQAVTVIDPGRAEPPVPGVTLLDAMPESLPSQAVVVLGIKPQLLPDVAPALAPLLDDRHIVVSMLAGMTVASLRSALGENAPFVRIMPNMAVLLGKGVCACHSEATAALSVAEALLEPLGLVERLGDEEEFNLVTALSGCGPAFLFRFVDALAVAAAQLGMAPAQAERMALATVEGAASLAVASDISPAVLADRVASKGGMTREGLDVLDRDDQLLRLLGETLRAARDRGEELNKPSS